MTRSLRPMVALLAGLALAAFAAGPAPSTPPPEPSVAPVATLVLRPTAYDNVVTPALAPVALERIALSAPALYSSVYASDHAPPSTRILARIVGDVERPPSVSVNYDGSAVLRPPFLNDRYTTASDLPADERPRDSATLERLSVYLRL